MVDVSFQEDSGSLLWITNQTRRDTANALRVVARHSHDRPQGDSLECDLQNICVSEGNGRLGTDFLW